MKKTLCFAIISVLLLSPVMAREQWQRVGYRLEGDINHDCVVDELDWQTILYMYGKGRGDKEYKGWMDSNKDGIIDIWDIGWVGLHYGSTC